ARRNNVPSRASRSSVGVCTTGWPTAERQSPRIWSGMRSRMSGGGAAVAPQVAGATSEQRLMKGRDARRMGDQRIAQRLRPEGRSTNRKSAGGIGGVFRLVRPPGALQVQAVPSSPASSSLHWNPKKMSAISKAVFLSYAQEDAVAAAQLAEALRVAGV